MSAKKKGGGTPRGDGGAASDWHLDTRAARAGKTVDFEKATPTSTPIVASSAFGQPSSAAIDSVYAGRRDSYVYGRYRNPTVDALESAMADLDGAEASAAYSSGMAAIAGAFEALELGPGSKILAARDLYGTTITWLEEEASRRDWQVVYVDFSDRSMMTSAVRDEEPSVVYCETLSNPLVHVVDLDSLGPACRDAHLPLVVDATFTPPCLLRPLEHYVALVVHSATKYLGGHGDLIGGVLSGSAELIDTAKGRRMLDGTIMDPFTAWLVLRGIQTLSIRLERQCANAQQIASHLITHHLAEQVHYPCLGRRNNPREQGLLDRLLPHGNYGAMISLEIAGADQSVVRGFVDALRLWGNAPTLGDLDSLVLIPAMTSHRHLAKERRAYMGITDNLVRLSVGIENVEDLIADLDQALAVCE